MLHSAINGIQNSKFTGWLEQFLTKCHNKSSIERGEFFAQDIAYKTIHHKYALKGQTEAPDPENVALFHFNSFVLSEEKLYLLDGRNEHPICKGSSTQASFFQDVVNLISPALQLLDNNSNFSLIALCKKE